MKGITPIYRWVSDFGRNHGRENQAALNGGGNPLARFVLPRCRSYTHALDGEFARVQRAQLEFPVGGFECRPHVRLRDNEGNVALRRTLCDRYDVDVLASQRRERAANGS